MPEKKEDLAHQVSSIVCNKNIDIPYEECFAFQKKSNFLCANHKECRIIEKSIEQLKYVLHPINKDSFLKACPGSGKTEVVGLKAAYEIKKWSRRTTGIAVLTYTNNARSVIKERILQFTGISGISYPHFIGTIDSWLLRFIFNPFAHQITGYTGDNGDHSIHILENSSDAAFLNNKKFSTKESYFKTGKISANQYYYSDTKIQDIRFSSGKIDIDNIRNKETLNLTQTAELQKIKESFWKSGFATYQDIETICYQILTQQKDLCHLVSKRFPVIIIDECQDISSIKIDIFRQLKNSGTVFHFVGDLNQSIYSYNNADSTKIEQFCKEKKFEELYLTKNFRSVQSIVDVCCNVVNLKEKISGNDNLPGNNHCIVTSFKKDNMDEISNLFMRLIKNRYEPSKSAILVRNNSNRIKILSGASNMKIVKSKYPPLAIYLWSIENIECKKKALERIGAYLSERLYPNEKYYIENYYCPKNISKLEWRLFLCRVLNDCNKSDELKKLSTVWSDWRATFNIRFIHILRRFQNRYDWLQIVETENATIRSSPQNEKSKPVIDTIPKVKSHLKDFIPTSTIHSAKGETFEAIMLVSSPDDRGQKNSGSGYWKHWLERKHAKGESARFAYVASSRPKYLLVWAIPEKDYVEKNLKLLKKYGFVINSNDWDIPKKEKQPTLFDYIDVSGN